MTTRAEKKMTKRQRRMQGPNPANTWQQQPNIKSSEARAKAYLLDAGLYQGSKSSSKKLKAEDLLDPKLDLNSPEVKFGRMLGGTDQRARHKAVAKLRSYLKARCDIRNVEGGVSELDMMKLWKVSEFISENCASFVFVFYVCLFFRDSCGCMIKKHYANDSSTASSLHIYIP